MVFALEYAERAVVCWQLVEIWGYEGNQQLPRNDKVAEARAENR